MRVLSFPKTVACAERIAYMATDTYFMPNKTIDELHEMSRRGVLDPLKEFSEAAREELQVISSLW